jgi:hypothetical protein
LKLIDIKITFDRSKPHNLLEQQGCCREKCQAQQATSKGEAHLYAASGILFFGCAVGRLPIETATRTIWRFYLAIFVALTMIAFIPVIYMTLTNLL